MRHNGELILDPSAIYAKAATRAEAARERYWETGMAANLAERVVIAEAVRAAGSHTPAEIGGLVHAAVSTFLAGAEIARQARNQLLAALEQQADRGLAAIAAMGNLVASGVLGTETFTESFGQSFGRPSTTGMMPVGPVGKEKPVVTETESRHREFKSNLPPNIKVELPGFTAEVMLPTPPPVDVVSNHEADYSFPDGGHLDVSHHVEVHVGTGTGGSISVSHHGGSVSRG